MINLELNKKSSIPLYVQIFEQISDKINSGSIAECTKLPSQREFALMLNVSVNTVVNAYNMLIQYEYIIAKNKSGYYVNKANKAKTSFVEKEWRKNAPLTYNFSRNGADLKMSESFKKVIRQTAKIITDKGFVYPDYVGDYELRKEICIMLNNLYEINCLPTQIIVGAGINYLLDLLIKVIGDDKVYGFENPYFYKINDFIKLSKYKTAYLNVTEDGVTSKELENFNADVLFSMPYHNYPLSNTLSIEQKKAVLDWAKAGRYVIEYGYDIDFVYSDMSKPMFSMTDNKNVIFINDFTKTISPGLNLAYLVLPESLVERWQKLYLNFHSYSACFEQIFISEVLKNKTYYYNIRRLRKNYNNKRNCLISAIKNHPIGNYIEIKNYKAGTFLIIQPKISCGADELIDECHKAGVKLSYIKNSLEQSNNLIYPKTYTLGFGELSEAEIFAGINLLLDTWEKKINESQK